MQKIHILLFLVLCWGSSKAQIDGTLLLGLTQATTTEMNAISNAVEGSLLYNTTESKVFQYNGSNWGAVGDSNSWGISGNSGTSSGSNFIGSKDAQDLILKSNNTEKLRLVNNRGQVLVNRANIFNNHPLVIRANGNDVLAFQDAAGTSKWHWNILGGGLNFVETGIADYRLFLQYGGNVGFNTSTPEYTADINGTARIINTPTISAATKVLVKNPTTGQISEQAIPALGSGKLLETIHGRAYFYNNTWYSTHDQYGTSYQNWNQNKGTSTTPSYSTAGQSGIPITSDMELVKFTMKNDFNSNPSGSQYINLSVLRGGSYTSIGTYTITTGSTVISIESHTVNFQLQENDLLVWACRTVGGANRQSYTSLTFEFGY
ncbi:hypothetical protein [Kriegella aquimaris]|uniref:Uncharacterized protein n=1 Tax=Kriegella aquimaris TaxID=192904 RepID=A0A1G9PGP0_9FLAO|nr:hypothetical protein [Kriegella aquimaris]SDL98032.1 hypothetical protein SAMN04488514_1042 [Kriegella aquimaris]